MKYFPRKYNGFAYDIFCRGNIKDSLMEYFYRGDTKDLPMVYFYPFPSITVRNIFRETRFRRKSYPCLKNFREKNPRKIFGGIFRG